MRVLSFRLAIAGGLGLINIIPAAHAAGPCVEGTYTVSGTAAPTTTIEVVRSGGRLIMRGGWGAFNETLHDSRVDGSAFMVRNENAFGSTVYSGTCSGGVISGKFENSRGFVGAMSGQLIGGPSTTTAATPPQNRTTDPAGSESSTFTKYGDSFMNKGRKTVSGNTIKAKRLAANHFRGAAEYYARASNPDRQREAVAAADAADAEADQLEQLRRNASQRRPERSMCGAAKKKMEQLAFQGGDAASLEQLRQQLATLGCNVDQQ